MAIAPSQSPAKLASTASTGLVNNKDKVAVTIQRTIATPSLLQADSRALRKFLTRMDQYCSATMKTFERLEHANAFRKGFRSPFESKQIPRLTIQRHADRCKASVEEPYKGGFQRTPYPEYTIWVRRGYSIRQLWD